jgi:hypothetical protein
VHQACSERPEAADWAAAEEVAMAASEAPDSAAKVAPGSEEHQACSARPVEVAKAVAVAAHLERQIGE